MGLACAKEQILSDHIKIRDLSIRTPQGELLLESADMDFRPGEITLLLGPSASGKSTWQKIGRIYYQQIHSIAS